MHVIWPVKPFDLSVRGITSNPSITKISGVPVDGDRTGEGGKIDYGQGDVTPYVRHYANV